KDWCHHTLNFDQPDWWKLTEKKLPIQNRSLSFTYLILSKVAKPNSTSWARIVGDPLKEKGKTKQLICRGPEREFFSVLKKSKKTFDLCRGDLIKIPENSVFKGNEVRLSD
ncbi:MAG: hypothetical protein KDD50_06775, partial [Bdellovibrionales bacterium]|nr:hypothetical protein [Bdellovibrionales bacterium]